MKLLPIDVLHSVLYYTELHYITIYFYHLPFSVGSLCVTLSSFAHKHARSRRANTIIAIFFSSPFGYYTAAAEKMWRPLLPKLDSYVNTVYEKKNPCRLPFLFWFVVVVVIFLQSIVSRTHAHCVL